MVQQFNTFWVELQSVPVIVQAPDEATEIPEETTIIDETTPPVDPPDQTPPTPSPTTLPPIIDEEIIHTGCGSDKVCFGYPIGCLDTKDCLLFGAVIYDEGRFIFELLSPGEVCHLSVISFYKNSIFKLALLTSRWAYPTITEWSETPLSSAYRRTE